MLESEKKFAFKKSRFELRYCKKTTIFANWVLLRNAWFWNIIFTYVRIWTEAFEMIGFCKRKLKTGKILKKSLQPKKDVLNYVTLWKRQILHDSRFFEKHDFKLGILRWKWIWKKHFITCQNLESSLRSRNHVMNNVTSWKHCFLQFPCLFETHDYGIIFYSASD